MPPVIIVAMPDLFSQLSRWEWLGLAVTVFILNTLFLKWFLAWSQADESSDGEKDVLGGSVQKGAPALAAAAIGGGGGVVGGSGRGNSPVMPGRPRRRKHLSDSGGAGTASSVSSPGVETVPPVEKEETPESKKSEPEPAAVLTGPSLLAPSVGIPISKRTPAETKPGIPEELKKPVVERSAEPPVRPTRRTSIPATGLPPAETPLPVAAAAAEEKSPADSSVESVQLPAISPAPAITESPVAAEAATPEPALDVDAVAALGRASFGKHAPSAAATPSAEDEKAATDVPEPVVLATPTLSDASSSLHVDAAAPVAASPVVEVAAVASEPPLETVSGVPMTKEEEHLALPVAAGAPSALASTASDPEEPVAEAAAPDENVPAMTSEPSEVAKTAETQTTHSSAEFAPTRETQESAAASSSTPSAGGRSVIARRAVGPARIFLTREFSSLRIKSNLNPPKTPHLAAARAQELASKVTPSIPHAPSSSSQAQPASHPEETAKPGADLIAAPAAGGGDGPTPPAPADTMPPESEATTPTPPTASEPALVEVESQESSPAAVAAPEETTPAAAPEPESVATPEPEAPPAVTPIAETPAAPALDAEDESSSHPAASRADDEKETAAPTETPATPTAEEESVEPAETPATPPTAESEPTAVEPEVPASVPVPPLPEEPVAVPATLEVPPIAPGPESPEQESAEPVDITASAAMLPPISTTDEETFATSSVAAADASPEPVSSLSTTRPVTPLMTTAPTSNGERATAQLTFSFEVASLQLTPFFKLGSVQLRPLSNVVSMQLAHGENAGTNPLSANIAFEILTTTTGGGSHGPVQALVLKPLSEARAAATPQPKLAVNAVQLTHGAEAGPIQITPAQSSATSVQVLATFAIAGIDFTPLFEIGSMRLEPTSAQVLLKVSSGSGQASSLDHLPPSFELTDVQVTSEGQISGFTLVPRAS